jgi:hypothetical protein
MGNLLKINCKNIGNVNYTREKRDANFIGLSVSPRLAIKLYDMFDKEKLIQNKVCPREMISGLVDFMDNEIQAKKIKPYSGMGFAIASNNTLNIAVWDKEVPYLLKNQLYEIKNHDIKTIKPLLHLSDGAFCAYELGIVSHEKNAWLKYLASKKTDSDKKRYLLDGLNGLL